MGQKKQGRQQLLSWGFGWRLHWSGETGKSVLWLDLLTEASALAMVTDMGGSGPSRLLVGLEVQV